ncbi:MAG: hypothetical protein AB1714_12130 [Acidobacteriota bacterium]
MKKLVWGIVIAGAVIILLALVGRGAVKHADETSGEATSVRVTRRTIETTVKATGVIRAMVGAEVKVAGGGRAKARRGRGQPRLHPHPA